MRFRISAADADGCGGESFYDFAHLAAAAQKGKRTESVAFSLRKKAAFSPKALPLRKQKGSAYSGADGQRLKRICV